MTGVWTSIARGAVGAVVATAVMGGLSGTARAAGADAPRGDWSYMVGGGVAYVPKYEGAKTMKVAPVPLVDITWKDTVFLGAKGLGAKTTLFDRLTLGGSVGYQAGRKEKNHSRLKGLGDVKDAAAGSLFASYGLGIVSFDLSATKDFGGSNGLTVNAGLGLSYPVTERFSLTSGVSATWADERHMRANFGVSAAQAKASGLAAYKAESGIKRFDVTVGANWMVTESWFVTANGGVGILTGDAKKSPVVVEKIQPMAMVGVGYRF